jgi:hypothetical protein
LTLSIGTRELPLWPTEIPIPFDSAKQLVEMGRPFPDGGAS